MIPAGRINPIAAKILQMYPMPNVEGTGAGGLTNNYRTQQRSTTDRHNFDGKVNWNRTQSHQLWGKFSPLHALVDDLFTFPIGESDDDGGQTTVYQITGGQTWSLTPTLLLDSSFGVSTDDQFVSSPDFHLGNLGLDLGIPGTNDQGRGDPRYAGLPHFATGFTAIGGTPTWSPIYMEQKTISFNTNLTKIAGKHDLKAGLLPESADDGQLAAGAGESARQLHLQRQRDADVRHRLADRELLQPVRAVPARAGDECRQELPVPALHRAASGSTRPSSATGGRQRRAHAGSRACAGSTTRSCGAPIARSRCSICTRSTC